MAAPIHRLSANSALVESLAAIEHERWSHWQRFLHSSCQPGEGGSLIIPAELVARWQRQMSRPYEELHETERASDRDQVLRYLPSIEAAIRDHTQPSSVTKPRP